MLLDKINKLKELLAKTTERTDGFNGIFLTRYRFAAGFAENKTILDIGAAFGEGTNFLAMSKAKSVLGIDYSGVTINVAKRNFLLPNLEFLAINALEIEKTQRTFDLIVALEIIEHLKPEFHPLFLGKIKNLLTPGGKLILSTPNKLLSSLSGRSKNPFHQKEFFPDELLSLLQNYFKKITLFGVRCVNQNFMNASEITKKKLGNRLSVFLSHYKIVQKMTPLVSRRLKRLITSEDSLPNLKADDFEISQKNIEDSESLMVVCEI